jgi:hypothetical protein
VGRIFADRRALRGEITSILDRIDEESFALMLVKPGALAALEILDDGLASTSPKHEKNLINAAMRLLDGPPGADVSHLADTLVRLIGKGTARNTIELQIAKRTAVIDPIPVGALAFLARLEAARQGALAEWARVRRRELLSTLLFTRHLRRMREIFLKLM